MALQPRQETPEYRDLDGMIGQKLVAAFRDPIYLHRVYSMVRLRRDRDRLYDHHWKAEEEPHLEQQHADSPEEASADDRLRAMSMAAEIYLTEDWKQKDFELETRKAWAFQQDQQQSPDPWIRTFPISKARFSPELVGFIEGQSDGWYGEVKLRATLASHIRQAGAHLIYRGILQGDGDLAERGRHMVQEGIAIVTGCMTGDTDHPLLRYVHQHYPGTQDGPDHMAVARERLDYITAFANYYVRDPASVSLLADFMRDTMTYGDSGIYMERARTTYEQTWGVMEEIDLRGATCSLLNFGEGRLMNYLRQALEEDSPEAVARVYIAIETALDTLINHDTPTICEQHLRSAQEFNGWLEGGEDGVRRGIQEKLALVLALDDFGERPLDHMIQDGLEQEWWITADGYATTMLLVAIREYPERGRLTPSLFLLSGE